MNGKLRTRRAFTLLELVAAIGILVVVLLFASVIFKVSINSHRTAGANAEVMQKLRAITDQLNIDFKGLRKEGYLILRSELLNRNEYGNSPAPANFRADRLFYFSTGDAQSWNFANRRSNITKVYFGHDSNSLYDSSLPVSKWSLARDVKLITPGFSDIDANSISFAEFKANVAGTESEAQNLLTYGIPIDVQNPSEVRDLMCQNVGEIKIEWTNGVKAPGDIMLWFGLLWPSGFPVEVLGPPYIATWTPVTPERYWPKALKFTFTIYDSKGILKQGRTFTHIVYFGD
jgi:prepilin-type N-terminal cleavage/methylation domain-containing protein